MATDKKINMPGSFGGLVRYDSEYKSKFMISPAKVIGFIAGIVVLVVLLKIIWPIG